MQTVLLIRHACSTNRQTWAAPDHLRPLSSRGREQAQMIAEHLGELDVASLRSSPAVRCVETVEPTARAMHITVETDETLSEGVTFELPSTPGLHIICAHGDNIAALLDAIGIEWHDCEKGSVWMIKRDETGEISDCVYFPPPDETAETETSHQPPGDSPPEDSPPGRASSS